MEDSDCETDLPSADPQPDDDFMSESVTSTEGGHEGGHDGGHDGEDDGGRGMTLTSRGAGKTSKDKLCLVCGDKALGYNFNAVSCESCKAFFRRNAFKEIRGRCEGKCDVNVESRSYCKRCRLQKCFTVGMKRDLILNDNQRQVRRQKIQDNRLRRQGLPVHTPADSSGTPPQPESPDTNSSSPSVADDSAESMTHVFAKSIDHNAIEKLPPKDRLLLEELVHAFELSFDAPMDRQLIPLPSSSEFLNMADSSVRRLVKMAKHLVMFRDLAQEDQIALLKGAVTEVLILRSAKMFDTKSMAWQVNKSGLAHNVSAMGLQFGNKDSVSFFMQYRDFVTAVLTCTRRDNVVLMLTMVMAVFAPDRERLNDKQLISQCQERYAQLLHCYITMHYPQDEFMFPKVLQKLADIRELNETHTKMLMHMKVTELEPLIVEIFDVSS